MAQSPPPPRSYTPVQHPQIHQPRPTNISLPSEPPAKRPRLSPTPSPFSAGPYAASPISASPLVPYSALPDHSPIQAFNAPQPVQPYHPDVSSRNATGTMGPPERPRKDKDMDVSDLQDVVNASGIDLREEENYMASTYRYRGDSSTQSTSFGSYTTSPNNSFGMWQQGSFGSYPAFQGTGPYSQPAVPQKTVEELVEEKHRLAARKLAEQQEKHIRQPFLNAEFVRNKLQDVTSKLNVKLTADGRLAQSDRPKVFGSYVGGTEGVGIVQARTQSAIHESSKIADLLSLISLATEERLRDILEDAVSIARSRRSTSDGVVPVDFVDIADGPSKPTKTTVTIPAKAIASGLWEGVQVPDSAVSPFTVVPPALKTGDTLSIATIAGRSSQNAEMSEADGTIMTNGETAGKPEVRRTDLPPTPPTSEPKDSIAFPSPFPALLRNLGNTDLSAEKARLEARKRRKAEREARDKERQNSTAGAPSSSGDARASPTSAAEPSAAATPSTPVDKDLKAEVAPVKLSKKEREKAAKASQTSEAAQRRDANATANMALGGVGKKYSWMNAASAAPAAPAFGAGAGMGPGRSASAAGPATAKAAAAPKETEEERGLRAGGAHRRAGLWAEAGPAGRGVQVRDVVAVLERGAAFADIGCEKVLARALVRGLRDEDLDVPVKDPAVAAGAAGTAAAAPAVAPVAAAPALAPVAAAPAMSNGAVAAPGVNGTR